MSVKSQLKITVNGGVTRLMTVMTHRKEQGEWTMRSNPSNWLPMQLHTVEDTGTASRALSLRSIG